MASLAVRGAAVTVTALALLSTPSARADDAVPPRWQNVVGCESGGDPSAVNATNPDRPAGLWQITTDTWVAFGGTDYAPTADRATPDQQLTVAERVLAGQGPSAWACPGAPGDTQTARPDTDPPPGPESLPTASTDAGNTHMVAPGETLSGIVGSSWPSVAAANGLPDPDLIFPGQVLRL